MTTPANSAPISKVFSVRSIFTTKALRPGEFGNIESRLRSIYQAQGMLGEGASSLMCAAHVSAEIKPEEVLINAVENDADEALAMLRAERSESSRSTFQSAVGNSNDYECFEAAFGLCALGVTEADKLHLLGALNSQTDLDRKAAVITALFQGGLLPDLIASGDLEEAMENAPLLEQLAELFDSGDPSSLIELAQSGDLSWQKRVCLHYILGLLAERFASMEYLAALLEIFDSEDDSDAQVMLTYATGQVVRRVGLAAAQRVLHNAIHSCSTGSRKQCLLINAIYRAELSAEEAETMIEEINAVTEEDSDTRRSLGRALDVFRGECDVVNWLFTGGYGRGIDLYDPFYSDRGFIPEGLWSIFNAPSRSGMRLWLKAVSKISISREFSALTGAVMLDQYPDVVPAVEHLVRKNQGSDNTRAGLAAALLCSPHPNILSPLFLRCLLNENHTGGPIIESPEIIGELIYHSQQSETQLVARELMRSLSPEGRAVCVGLIRAQLNHNDPDEELSKLLFSLGASHTPQGAATKMSVELKIAVGDKVSAPELAELLRQSPEEEREELASLLISALDDSDRQSSLRLAKNSQLWSAVPMPAAQSHILALSRGGWVAREVACVFAGTLGAEVLTGALGSAVSDTIQRLCNDSDSDVTREAQRAATLLNLKVLIINEENIKAGLTSDDAAEWTQRLYEFLKAEDDRSEILSLCRSAEVWTGLDQDELSAFWLELSRGGWIAREAAAVIAINHPGLLVSSQAQEISSRLLELSRDDDSDVEREAKTACVTLGL